MEIRTRFAPSPTGFLHIGGLRTALFAFLLARHEGGKFLLRIEDTDQKREVKNAKESLVEILDWCGIEFDEGPHVGGKYGPYIQSERQVIYDKYKEVILKSGHAYHCFCTAERLQKMRDEQQSNKLPPRYDKCCRNLTKEEIEKRIANGGKYVIRQKMPLEGEVIVKDEIRGEIRFPAKELEDQVLIKSNGVPTYQFASVVDDHLMKITHVTRTEEWLPSFPKNILLYQAFGWEAPLFIHFPFVANKGGGKLSKRQGDVSVESFRDNGYLPEALLNFNVLLGWHPEGDNEVLGIEEMIKQFNYKKVGISPAVFDNDKLDYFNGYYIRQLSQERLLELAKPFISENLKLTNKEHKKSEEYIKKIIIVEQERLKKLSEIANLTRLFFLDELDYPKNLLIWKKLTENETKNNLQVIKELLLSVPDGMWSMDEIEKTVISYLKDKSLKAGDYLWPTRVALTGEKQSPGPFAVAWALGKEEAINRINKAIGMLID